MLKNYFTYLTFIFSLTGLAQTSIETDLDSITSFEKAQEFLKDKHFKQNKFITFNEEKHKTTLAKDLFSLSLGGTKTFENDYEKTVYKIVEKSSTTNYRTSYIFLDGNMLSLDEINSMRDMIIRKYQDGASFNFLARQYSMDINANKSGDTGWFSENFFDPDLEDIIVNDQHNLDDIYTSEIPNKKKYYVILKTYEPKEIAEIKVLKIVDEIE